MPKNFPTALLDKRPWGKELWFDCDAPAKIKILSVLPSEVLSLQYHHLRDEYWYVISGNGEAEKGDEKIKLETGTECFVTRETKHRLRGGTETLVLLELSFGTFDEKDIVRLEDKYGRV